MNREGGSPRERFYRDLVAITERAINEKVALDDMLEVLMLHALSTFLRDSSNSFCCATDIVLQILSTWYTKCHEDSMGVDDSEECSCSAEDEDSNSTMH